jgi:hypothetical protein
MEYTPVLWEVSALATFPRNPRSPLAPKEIRYHRAAHLQWPLLKRHQYTLAWVEILNERTTFDALVLKGGEWHAVWGAKHWLGGVFGAPPRSKLSIKNVSKRKCVYCIPTAVCQTCCDIHSLPSSICAGLSRCQGKPIALS